MSVFNSTNLLGCVNVNLLGHVSVNFANQVSVTNFANLLECGSQQIIQHYDQNPNTKWMFDSQKLHQFS